MQRWQCLRTQRVRGSTAFWRSKNLTTSSLYIPQRGHQTPRLWRQSGMQEKCPINMNDRIEGMPHRFQRNLSWCVTQVAERGTTQAEPEETLLRDAPDICLVERRGPYRRVLQTTECKTK